MAVVSGISSAGVRVIVNQASPFQKAFQVIFPGSPIPPFERLGYFWLARYENASPFQTVLLDRGAIYRPGIYSDIRVQFLSTTQSLRLECIFDFSDLAYTITLV